MNTLTYYAERVSLMDDSMRRTNEHRSAYSFAAGAHAAVGQKRKYSGKDYIVHPRQVAIIVDHFVFEETSPIIQFANPMHMIDAAFLHDTVEDTNVTLSQIEEYFGITVKDLVEGLTNISRSEDGNRDERKAIDRRHTAKAGAGSQYVKCADLIANTIDITLQDHNFAVVYLREKRLLLDVMDKVKETNLYKFTCEVVEAAENEIRKS